MADFCKKHSIELWGEDLDEVKAEAGKTLSFLCEGCGGYVTVNEHGDLIENLVDFKTGEWLPEKVTDGKETNK